MGEVPLGAEGPTVPDFTSDRMVLLAPLVTPRAVELARARILRPKHRLVQKAGKTPGEDPADVKVALMLVALMNPDEALTNEEDGLRRGLAAKTTGKRKSAGEI